jgi:hypothetical protein
MPSNIDLSRASPYLLRPMDEAVRKQLVPGAVVKITQQIAARNYSWSTDITGTVVEYSQQETGSWYAHSKNDKLWLDRLTLRKPDGEITTLNLDEFSVVQIQSKAPAVPATA